MRISDWSSDVCSSDLIKYLWLNRILVLLTTVLRDRSIIRQAHHHEAGQVATAHVIGLIDRTHDLVIPFKKDHLFMKLDFECPLRHFQGEPHTGRSIPERSEEHTSELQSLMRSSYAVFCLKKKTSKH